MRYLKEHAAQNGAVLWDSSTPASNLGILIHQYEDKVLLFGGRKRVEQSVELVADILNLELVTVKVSVCKSFGHIAFLTKKDLFK